MLTSLALIFLCGLLMGGLLQKCKLPGLIGMLLTGIVLGPSVLNVLDGTLLSISADLRQIALIIILARAGLSLAWQDLKSIGRPAVLMSFVPACFEMAGTILIAPWLLHIPVLDAAILAAVVASASPAVIVPRMVKLMEAGYGTDKHIPQMILAGDSVDDVFNIVVFSALIGLAGGEAITPAQFIPVPISIASGIGVGLLVGFGLARLLPKIHLRDSAKVLVLLGIAFLLVTLEEYVQSFFPFSGLVAVMAAGAALLQTAPAVAKRLSAKLSKLWVAAEILLFALVGAGMDISCALSAGGRTILLLLAILLIRAVGIALCLLGTNLNNKERLFCALTGIPKATVQAAIGGIPLALGLSNGNLIWAVAVLTILFTAPLGAFLLDSTCRRLLHHDTGL